MPWALGMLNLANGREKAFARFPKCNVLHSDLKRASTVAGEAGWAGCYFFRALSSIGPNTIRAITMMTSHSPIMG